MLLTLASSGFESDKVPFYVVAGGLAIWAVVLSYIGLSRPQFPGGERGQRVVLLISFLLMAGTMAAAVATG